MRCVRERCCAECGAEVRFVRVDGVCYLLSPSTVVARGYQQAQLSYVLCGAG